MKKNIFFVAVALATLCSSCITSKPNRYDEQSARYLSPSMSGFVTPVAVDLNVQSKQTSYTKTFENKMKIIDVTSPKSSGVINYMKSITMVEAAKECGADVIVIPTFTINTSKDLKTVTVTVTGFAATYTNPRKATAQDVDLYQKCIEIDHDGLIINEK